MGSTYLDLTNRVLRRLNEVEIGSSDFSGVRGIQAAAKDAVLDTVRNINSQKFEWPFNAAAGTQVLTVGQEEYSWPTDLRRADWNSFYIQADDTLSIKTTRLQFVNRDEWYRYGRPADLDSTTDGLRAPRYVFESANGGFGVTPSPDEAYTVKFSYWIKTITLSAYSDTCTIPTEYDNVITDGAMNLIYLFLDNDERAAAAMSAFNKGLDYMTELLVPKDHYMWDHRITRPPRGNRRMFTYT